MRGGSSLDAILSANGARASDKVGVSACCVAQICNLLYRRFLIGKAPEFPGGLQVANLFSPRTFWLESQRGRFLQQAGFSRHWDFPWGRFAKADWVALIRATV